MDGGREIRLLGFIVFDSWRFVGMCVLFVVSIGEFVVIGICFFYFFWMVGWLWVWEFVC